MRPPNNVTIVTLFVFVTLFVVSAGALSRALNEPIVQLGHDGPLWSDFVVLY